jgi:glutathione S-transferase
MISMKSIRFIHRSELAIQPGMSFTYTLYYSPGAVSLATHIALEEVGARYRLEPILVREGQQNTEAYRRIHPLGRVPALEVAPDTILTETPALLGYLADQAPTLELLPREPLLRARANEWMSLISSAIHVAFISHFRPSRYTSDEAAAAALKVDGKARFFELLRYVEARLPPARFVLGDRYSLCDAYLTVPLIWARRVELPVGELPRYSALAAEVLARPAVRRTLQQEGLEHLYQ